MEGRRSIRKYKAEPLSAEVIERIVKAARLAPSWKNSQTARFTAVCDKELKDDIAQNGVLGFAKNKGIISSAPAVVVLSTVDGVSGYNTDKTPSTAKGSHWQSFDAGAAAYAFCLAAKNEGLGTCIMGLFDEPYISKAIGLPEEESISAVIALGVPDESPAMPKRKELSEVLRFK